MNKSPGHQKFPEHKVQEQRVGKRMTVVIDGDIIADSNDVICVDEDKNPLRYYFPRADVAMSRFVKSGTTTECPFKGTAKYYSLIVGPQKLQDVVWTYDKPYDEHRELKGRLAFYDEKIPGIQVRQVDG